MSGYMSRGLVLSVMACVCLYTAGCGPMPGEKVLVDVAGEYHGLVDQRVAVMIAADSHMLHRYPQAPRYLSKAVTARIAHHVPGVTMTIPEQVVQFQTDNPYWMNMRYGELVEKMGVDKIVLVDLVEYQTHEPGNAHIWQGLITANLGVIDAQAEDPDNFVYYNTVTARFPEQSSIGLIDSDERTIRLGMVLLFSREGGGLFYDHQIEVDK